MAALAVPSNLMLASSIMRGWVQTFVVLLALLASDIALAKKPKLLVYVPTSITVREFQSRLQGQLPAVEIRAYGRIKDFERAIKSEQPDGLLSFPAVLETQSLASKVQGNRKGSSNDSYVLVTLEKGASTDSLDGSTIGVLDLLGRKRMPGLVTAITGIPGKPKLKRVKRLEDLVSLLLLGMADSILVPARAVDEMKKSSGANLVTTPVKGGLALPSLGVINQDSSQAMADALTKLDSKTNLEMGVDKWLQL